MCTEKTRECLINFPRRSDEMWTHHHPIGISVSSRGKERETFLHFYCRKSGSANALVTRRFPVTCCPRSMSPRVSLPWPRGIHEPVPARSGRPLLAGVPVDPLSLDTLESALQTFGKFSRIRNPFSEVSALIAYRSSPINFVVNLFLVSF